MNLKNLNFEQWQKNHIPDHNDKWCRELYPFNVFKNIDFNNELVAKEQQIDFNGISYFVILTKIELQENSRFKTTFDIATFPKSSAQKWKKRKWNTTFQIVYSQDYEFITIFSKKEDPSKDYVVRFMKGNYQKIHDDRSIPVSELLIRTLTLHIAEELYIGGKHNEEFDFTKEGVRNIPEHPHFPRKKANYFAPIYSISRDLWVCYSFSEEKAHRIAFYNANQCHALIVVYCNPTYTIHHRCLYENTHIISIYEFSEKYSPEIRKKYEDQIRFLQNRLNKVTNIDSSKLLNEINNPIQEIYEIQESDLMEAFGVMKILPKNEDDLFHSLCCFNLINAFLSRKLDRKIKLNEKRKFKNLYFFKKYLSEMIATQIEKDNHSVPIYLTKDLLIIELYGFQFSFHNVPLNSTLKEYSKTELNKEIKWNGKRLQPIASLLLKYSRILRDQKK